MAYCTNDNCPSQVVLSAHGDRSDTVAEMEAFPELHSGAFLVYESEGERSLIMLSRV